MSETDPPPSPPQKPHDELDFAPVIEPEVKPPVIEAVAPEPAPPSPPPPPPVEATSPPPPGADAAPHEIDYEWKEVADPEDVRKNKGAAMIGYAFFFLPLIVADKSRFARFHANQSLVLLCAGGGLMLGCYILANIVSFAFGWTALHYFIVGPLYILVGAAWISSLCLAVMGVIHAYNGEMAELPVIGTYRILK